MRLVPPTPQGCQIPSSHQIALQRCSNAASPGSPASASRIELATRARKSSAGILTTQSHTLVTLPSW